MTMFGWLKSPVFQDTRFGELHRSRGYWKGGIALPPCGAFRLALPGSREAPDPQALALAEEATKRFRLLMQTIQQGLFEHYLPYKEAADAETQMANSFPQPASAEAVWSHVMPAHVLIERFENAWTIEIAFKTAWDVEHTVAAVFRDWQFIELNGSVRRR